MYTDGNERLSHKALQNRLGISFPKGRPPEKSGFRNVEYTPPEPTFEERKQRKRSEINQAYQSELSPYIGNYPEIERLTWTIQESEARNSGSKPTPFLDALSSAEGKDKSQLASSIIQRADDWVQISAAATGKRHNLQAAIDAATTLEALDLINW